ncbi:GNAT family N-acetyltransferase [Hassallia byssoidea VB512170]|uniref:GNAT family N-acetyltransferase n=1 Tax=Hassallia byssoidea VB512170 TaxID=1304833 RepID=A0A846HCY3_9CYAN|nr:GNAT family N-acetyltransferase [Hassalia byssoidea]NEU75225.1 GNAT family N-acetyltransferase [Hassalia byssoidea VB512170]
MALDTHHSQVRLVSGLIFLFVNPEMRSQGAGAALMNQLARIAQEHDCTHLAWNADAKKHSWA